MVSRLTATYTQGMENVQIRELLSPLQIQLRLPMRFVLMRSNAIEARPNKGAERSDRLATAADRARLLQTDNFVPAQEPRTHSIVTGA